MQPLQKFRSLHVAFQHYHTCQVITGSSLQDCCKFALFDCAQGSGSLVGGIRDAVSTAVDKSSATASSSVLGKRPALKAKGIGSGSNGLVVARR